MDDFGLRLQGVIDEAALRKNLQSLNNKFDLVVNLKFDNSQVQSELNRIRFNGNYNSQQNYNYSTTTTTALSRDVSSTYQNVADDINKVVITNNKLNDSWSASVERMKDLNNVTKENYILNENGEQQLVSEVQTRNTGLREQLTLQKQNAKSIRQISYELGDLQKQGALSNEEITMFNQKLQQIGSNGNVENTKLQLQSLNKEIKESVRINKQNERGFYGTQKSIDALGSQSKLTKKEVITFTERLQDIKNSGLNPIEKSRAMEKLNTDIKAAAESTGILGQSFGKAATKYVTWLGIATGIALLQRAVKNMISQVHSLDDAMVELSKVTDTTVKGLENVKDQAFLVGKQLGTTGEGVLKATTEFARAGYTIQQSLDLAQVAITLTNVAENINNTAEAATYLISILKGADLPISEASKLLDELNQISNNFAVDLGSLADMVQRIAGTMSNFGNSVEQTMALVTGAYEVLQDERVARGISTIAARIAGLNEDLEAEEGLANDVSNALRKYAKIDVFDLNGQLRDTYDILEELAGKWDGLSKNAQSVLLNIVAGKTRMDVLSSILTNWEGVSNSLIATTEAEGSAAEEQNKYLESISGKISQLSNAWQSLASTTVESDIIKWFVDFATAIVKAVDACGGLVNVLLLVSGVVSSIKLAKVINGLSEGTIALKSMTTAATSATQSISALKLAFTGLSSLLGVLGLVLSVVGLINSANKEREQERLQRISNIQKEIDQVKSLKSSYMELINSGEDLEIINSKIQDKYEKLTKLAKSYAIAIDDLNGKQKDYLTLANEINIAQTKQINRESLSQYTNAQKYLETSRGQQVVSLSGDTYGLSQFGLQRGGEKSVLNLFGTPEERLRQISAILEQLDSMGELSGNQLEFYKQLTIVYGELSAKIQEQTEIIASYEYNEQLIKFSEEYQKTLDNLNLAFEGWSNKTKQEQASTAQSMINDLDNFVNKVKEDYPLLADYILNTTETMRNSFKTALNYDILLDYLEEKQTLIKQAQKEQEEELKTQEKLLAVEKARLELEEARRKRLTVFRAGKGYVSEFDYESIQKAQENLIKAERSAGIDSFSMALTNIDALIKYYNQAQLDQAEAELNTMRQYFADAENMATFLALSIEEKLKKLGEWITTENWQKTSAQIDVSGFYANGTTNSRGGLAVVGEKGPELVNLPHGSEVLSNQKSMRLTSIVNDPSQYLKGDNKSTVLQFNGDLSFPNVRNSDDASGFIDALISLGVGKTPKLT